MLWHQYCIKLTTLGGNIFFILGSVAFRFPPNTEDIFSRLAISIMQYYPNVLVIVQNRARDHLSIADSTAGLEVAERDSGEIYAFFPKR